MNSYQRSSSEKTPLSSGIVLTSYSPVNATEQIDQNNLGSSLPERETAKTHWTNLAYFALVFALLLFAAYKLSMPNEIKDMPIQKGAWSSQAAPFSTVNPADLNISVVDRPKSSSPGPIFAGIDSTIPLPTNGWYENLFLGPPNNTLLENNVFQVPYILDTAGYIQGVRTHAAHVQANDRTVMMTYEPMSGLSLGAMERFHPQHYVRSQGTPAVSNLGVELEWISPLDHVANTSATQQYRGPTMRSPIVRGAPYTSMMYLQATPRVFVQRSLSGPMVVDNDPSIRAPDCGQGFGVFSETPVLVQSELRFHLDTSDATWLLFVSEPTEFICSTTAGTGAGGGEPLPPGVVGPAQPVEEGPAFELRAVSPMQRGMVRVAIANNCTTGQNPQFCERGRPRNQSEFESLLRRHADVYPTARADIRFTFPVETEVEDEVRLIFNWKPAHMSHIANQSADHEARVEGSVVAGDSAVEHFQGIPQVELLMVALPHQQQRVRPIVGSSNTVLEVGCVPTIHGHTCPILGSTWSMVEHLHRVDFTAPRPIRREVMPAVRRSLKHDLQYSLPPNYMAGAGDTYFSGKMLAKLARVLLVADEVGDVDGRAFKRALSRLRQGVEVWLNGSAQSPFLYDGNWGGLVTCGCNYVYENGVGFCANAFPNCPALTDAGQNFGVGFYNDHHFHYGYHIYAAAALSKFDPAWGKAYHQHVLLLVRDIANPSDGDPFFPTFRHKDWFLGFSWASGVVTIQGRPYPNGRNQESSSEAIAAYEAVALYGGVMARIFTEEMEALTPRAADGGEEEAMELERVSALWQAAERVHEMGRLLVATEIRSAIAYWHVQAPGTEGVTRIYPEVYAPKVVGMMWSMLAQEQTWFGNEPWKSYGIQLMPLTALSEQRDNVGWVREMLPIFNHSCATNPVCQKEGWSVLVSACLAEVGQWELAFKQVQALPLSVFEEAGGNGHSLTNTLWYIGTRPKTVSSDSHSKTGAMTNTLRG